jgi:hypothetical protein
MGSIEQSLENLKRKPASASGKFDLLHLRFPVPQEEPQRFSAQGTKIAARGS